jgi:serine/threonine-protein kinase
MVRDADAKTAAHKLGVANILTGSVRRSPTMVRVSAQLVDGRDGLERWSANYDRTAGDILKIQTDIAQSVARSLSIELGQSQRESLFAGGTDNPQANDLILRASPDFLPDGEAGLRRGIALADAAIALDPNYANAYAVKALLQNFIAGQYAPSSAEAQAGMEQAAATAQRAIAIAPDVGVAYMILATIRANQLQFAEALKDFQRGERLPGSEIGSQRGYSTFLSQLGRNEEAWQKASAILPSDPLNPAAFGVQARILYDWRRYDQAIKYARRSLDLAPQRFGPRILIGSIFVLRGRLDEAQSQFDRLPENNPYRLQGEGLIAAKRGDRNGAAAKIAEMVSRYGDAMNYQIADVEALLGDKDKAMAALDRAYALRDPGLASIQVDPYLDPLRGDPRFQALVRKLDFPT